MITLTEQNYYTLQASRDYMSCSQYAAFMECPERAYRTFILGDIQKEQVKAFTDGNFAHSYFQSHEAHQAFIDEHPELLSSRGKTKGDLKSEYLNAYKAFEDAKKDELFMHYMTGKKEVIFTGELCGMMWSIKADVVNDDEGFSSDFKYMAKLDGDYWMQFAYDSEGNIVRHGEEDVFSYRKNVAVPFYEYYHYWRRFAVYRQILHKATGNIYRLFMPVITKEFPANRAVYEFNNAGRFLIELQDIEKNMPRIREQRNGNDLTRCGKCSYCRASLKKVELQEATSLW